MRIIHIILLAALCSLSYLNAQSLNFIVKGSGSDKAFLFSVEGEKTFLIDSLTSKSKDHFTCDFTGSSRHPGLYRLLVLNKRIDFIYDGEDILIKTESENPLDSMKVEKSESNSIYYSFVRLNRQYKTKSELLQLILMRYPKDDNYYRTTINKFEQLQKEYTEFVDKYSRVNPNSFIAKYVKSAQLPIVNFLLPLDKQLSFLKSHSLDNIDFTDAGLIYSDLLTNKTIEYLTYFGNPQLPKELLEKEFMKAVDSLLNRAKVHPLVYQHIVEYLIDGFKKYGMDMTLDYIVQNYVIKDDLCLDPKTESSIQRRIDQNKKLHLNSPAPDIKLPDINGRVIELSKLKSANVLIVFYASWCPHCTELIPELDKLYKDSDLKQFEILAVSLDEKKEDWINFVKKNKLDWLNVSDLKGWNSKAASDYFIYATPTMFLVNNKLNITGKPLTIAELELMLQADKK
ncbi:MAG: hypothetical protein CVV24_09290 [Ignavibacteriae bacterium HGW-Ignavibacteriae-3]|nr:MAG: hypothetical protein CVV24_09290 [Ignavibacteriae bacterium HGW-Ignavibacteriae-3]